MNREDGISEIESAEWTLDEWNVQNLHVTDRDGRDIHAHLTLRPIYCDRGHIHLLIDGMRDIDEADSFPRFFFRFYEADLHTRMFLKWRLWRMRTFSHDWKGDLVNENFLLRLAK